MSKILNEEIRNALIEASNEFGKDTVIELLNTLKGLNKVASGRLINSLNYKLRGAISGIDLEFEAEDYIIFIDKGRKPGKFVPVNALRDWCKTKGIDEKFVYPINLKIKRVGITPTKFIDEVFNNERINTFYRIIEDKVGNKIENNIDETFKNNNK